MTTLPLTIANGSRRALLLVALVALVALASGLLTAQTKPGKVLPGAAKPAPAVMIDRLAQQADVAVVGHVSELRSEWNEDKSRIQTRVTVAVEQTLKGPAAQETITLVVPGGEVDGVGELYSHMAQFQANEDVLVFASKDAKGDLRVTSGLDGKFAVAKDPKTGARSIPNLGSIEDVSARVTRSVKAQSTEPKRN
jgi:hypothetical protein